VKSINYEAPNYVMFLTKYISFTVIFYDFQMLKPGNEYISISSEVKVLC